MIVKKSSLCHALLLLFVAVSISFIRVCERKGLTLMSCSDSKVIDNVKHYLRSIGEYPILTQAEEIALFKRIKEGDKEARNTLIHCNLKLVVSAAKQYAHFSISLMDLIQEGNLGLMKATEDFDPSMGYLSTYAMQWIRQYICRFIMDKGKVIHIPVHVLNMSVK